jgi:glutamyl-tRNA synthetase
MSQYQLTVATRANQPYVLPVLLVATSINEARPSPVISITYEDTAVLREGDKAVVQYTGASGNPIFGLINAVQELRKDFPFLNSKDEKLVRGAMEPYC